MTDRKLSRISLGAAACAVVALAAGGQAVAQERSEYPYHDPMSRYQNPGEFGDTGYYLSDDRYGAYDRQDRGVYDRARDYREPYGPVVQDYRYRDNYDYRTESGRRIQDPAGQYDRRSGQWRSQSRYNQPTDRYGNRWSGSAQYGTGYGQYDNGYGDRYGQMDVDRDGTIDANEASYWASAHFRMMDLDGDGEITESEFRRADRRLSDAFHRGSQQDYEQAREEMDVRFSEYDGPDNDGIITRSEFMEQARTEFEGFERDENGEVSVWDYRSGDTGQQARAATGQDTSGSAAPRGTGNIGDTDTDADDS